MTVSRCAASLLLCALFIGLASPAASQPVPLPFSVDFRSQIIDAWDGSSWAEQSRTINTFDGDDNLVEAVVQQRDGGAWVNLTRTINTYDTNDRLEQAVTETWDDTDNEWDKGSRTTNTYDGDGNLTEALVESWNGAWQPASRTLNTYEDGNITSTKSQIRAGSNWVTQTETLYAYDSQGRLEETIVKQFGMNQTRTTNTYDNGRLVRERVETWSSTRWVKSTQTLYTNFDANDQPETVTEQTWNGSDWDNLRRDLNTFSGMKLTQALEQTWNGSDWNDESQTTITYNGHLVTEVVEETWNGASWNNANRTAITYDSMDRIITFLTQTGDGSGWENEGRIRYSYDDILPVELIAFTVTSTSGAARLHWTTATEANNAGFEVERQLKTGGAFSQIGFVEGHGTTSEPQQYRFVDEQVPFDAGQVAYRLRQVDFDGTHAYSPVVELDRSTPEQLALHANYPNPFHTRTAIRYELPQAGPARLAVYNVLGQRIVQLLRGDQPAGRGEVVLQHPLPSGVYFLRLDANGRSATRQITVVK